jgi:hypothetical protein
MSWRSNYDAHCFGLLTFRSLARAAVTVVLENS